MKKLLLFIVLLLLFSGCAYQRYYANLYKPDQKDNKVRDCSVYDNANTMKEHYKKRNR